VTASLLDQVEAWCCAQGLGVQDQAEVVPLRPRASSKPHLPAGPLVEAVEARLERLAAAMTPLTDSGVARGEALAEVFAGNDALQRAYYRARQHGTLTLRAAEQLCDHFGWHPRMLWRDAYDAAAFAGCDQGHDPWAGVA
jgi:hypothetical protein